MAIILAIWPAAPFCGRSRFATMEGLGSFRRYAVLSLLSSSPWVTCALISVGYVRFAHFTHGYEKSRPYRAPFLLLLTVGCALFECLPTVMKNHALRADAAARLGHALRADTAMRPGHALRADAATRPGHAPRAP